MDTVERVISKLIENNMTISFAESCTGGLATAALVSVADASKVLNASIVTYANEAKIDYLGVDPEAIAEKGVVSELVAGQMAAGVAKRNHAEVGVGISGIAGPSGGSAEKPVGMVCFGISMGDIVDTYTAYFGNIGRNNVREKSVEFVYEKLMEKLG